jgi:hypothetical protein
LWVGKTVTVFRTNDHTKTLISSEGIAASFICLPSFPNFKGETFFMTFKTPFRLLVMVTAVFAFAGMVAAQGTVYNSSPSTSNLAVSATVQSALNLDISSDSEGVTVGGTAGSGSFTLDFGNVNGLGVGTPATNVTKSAVAGGFLYTTPITLTPNFSGFEGYSAASIKVEQAVSDDAPSKAAAREGISASINGATVLTTGATAFTVLAANGTPITRYIGVKVLSGNNTANSNAGARSINLVYTISVP